MTRQASLGCVAALVLAAVAAPSWDARADDREPKLEEAKRDFAAGAAAFSVGQFDAATQLFARSYALAPRPGTLFSLAQAERRQYYVDRDPAHLVRAIDAIRRYVSGAEQGSRRAEAVDLLTELEPLYERVGKASVAPQAPAAKPVTRLMVTSRAGAAIVVDGKHRAETPFIGDIDPGRHGVTVDAPGYFQEAREVEVKDGAFVVLDVTLRERPGSLEVRAPSGAEVFVDGVSHGTAPLAAMIAVPAGEHAVSVVRSGTVPWARIVRVDAGDTAPLKVELDTSAQRRVAWVTVATGGVGLATAGVFFAAALAKESEARSFLRAQASGPVSVAQIEGYQSARGARDDWRRAAEYAGAASVALFAIGGALVVLDRPAPPRASADAPRKSPSDVRVLPSAGGSAGGMGVGVTGLF